MLSNCAARAGADIGGIGIGCTGPVYPHTGEIGDVEFLKSWKGGNLAAALETRFGVRVALENDADSAALGEAFWGAGRGNEQVIFVTVGTGIGVGIVLHGELYRGVEGAHPEIGHQIVEASGPQCYCGARGCWEALAAGPAMTRWMSEHRPHDELSAEQICKLAAAGDELALHAVEREAHYLGLGLANLVNIFCPQGIVLGGSVMAARRFFSTASARRSSATAHRCQLTVRKSAWHRWGRMRHLSAPRRRGIIDSAGKGSGVSLDLEVIRGRYLSDVLSQPEALRATRNGLRHAPVFDEIARASHTDRFARVVLTGMGSSYFGLHPLSIELAAHGWTPLMLETSELIHYYPHLLTPSTLVVAVSQSGKSVEMVRMLKLNARKATVIGITNHIDGPLAREADFVVLTHAGEEFSVSCKTYLAAQMALPLLAAALCGLDRTERLAELEPAADAVEHYLQQWTTHVEEFAALLRDVRDIFLVGRGSSLAAACTGALIIKESDHFHAEGMSSAAFRHGPFEMLERGRFVGIFGGDGKTRNLNDGLLEDVARTPAACVMFAADSAQPACRVPQVPEIATPIAEILPIQMITLSLAALSQREPGKFERATKVTAVE